MILGVLRQNQPIFHPGIAVRSIESVNAHVDPFPFVPVT